MAGRRIQRISVHVLQVPDRRADRIRGRLVRRAARRHGVGGVGRLGSSAALPAPEGGLVEIRCGRGLDADVQPARVAVESRHRPLPDVKGPRAALRAGMTAPPYQYYDDGLVQLDREAITLRRYHFPSGTSKVVPLRSIRGYKVTPL